MPRSPREPSLDDSVDLLKGIGPVARKGLEARGVHTLGDLLLLLPIRYDDQRDPTPLSEIRPGERVITEGVVRRAKSWRRGRRATVTLEVESPNGEGSAEAVFWNARAWQRDPRFQRGARLRLVGEVSERGGRLQLLHPETELDPEGTGGRLVSVYPEVDGVPRRRLASLLADLIPRLSGSLEDAAPPWLVEKRRLPALGEAVAALHAPPQDLPREEVDTWGSPSGPWRRRLAYGELLLLQLRNHLRRHDADASGTVALSASPELEGRIGSALGFELTRGQARSIAEIRGDLARDRPMRRLLQGDVGSGKTAVALAACVAAVEGGRQAVLMSPTEVLAEQHHRTISAVAEELGLPLRLLTGSTERADRSALLSELARGVPALVVGTHALVQAGVELPSLGVVVVDEQHRFGVGQRLALVRKGEGSALASPHLLVMTATPIPRTLALALYGDLDMSVIDELPPGRRPTETVVLPSASRREAYDALAGAVEQGQRGFVICPLIDESGALDLRPATALHEELAAAHGEEAVALLHGRLSAVDRVDAMSRFVEGRAMVLVSTSVVEVGVDVPSATIMVVEGAERFGLSQLHQLRGRVGRGKSSGRCFLISDRPTVESERRLEGVANCTDGFALAELDLEIRGPGELLGRRQSGLPGLRHAHLARDVDLLSLAQEDAAALVERDPELSAPENDSARQALARLNQVTTMSEAEEAG